MSFRTPNKRDPLHRLSCCSPHWARQSCSGSPSRLQAESRWGDGEEKRCWPPLCCTPHGQDPSSSRAPCVQPGRSSRLSCDSSCLLPLKCFHCNACVLNDRRDGSCFRGHASGQQPPSLLLHVNSEDGEAFPAAGGS